MSRSDTPTHSRWNTFISDAVPAHRDFTGQTAGSSSIKWLLGRGGVDNIYLSPRIGLDRRVAPRMLKDEPASNSTYLARPGRTNLGSRQVSSSHVYQPQEPRPCPCS